MGNTLPLYCFLDPKFGAEMARKYNEGYHSAQLLSLSMSSPAEDINFLRAQLEAGEAEEVLAEGTSKESELYALIDLWEGINRRKVCQDVNGSQNIGIKFTGSWNVWIYFASSRFDFVLGR